MKIASVVTLLVVSALSASARLREGDCEVCIKVANTIGAMIDEKGVRNDKEAIRKITSDWCEKTKIKPENTFCYKLGALKTSASSVMAKWITPLSFHLPSEKICERLKKADGELCETKYPAPIDLTNLSKLRVKQLRKVLSNWGETCRGCAEKRDFINKIKEVRHKHEEL